MKGKWVFIPSGQMSQQKGWWTRALEDPSSGEPSISRIGTAWCLFVLTPALIILACLGFFPSELAVKWSLGLLAAPAVVYGVNSAAGAWKRQSITHELDQDSGPPDLATGAATAELE